MRCTEFDQLHHDGRDFCVQGLVVALDLAIGARALKSWRGLDLWKILALPLRDLL